jgi:lipopolysaccharide/colanic/teichoic acid biosynthesis glycosyltransferase
MATYYPETREDRVFLKNGSSLKETQGQNNVTYRNAIKRAIDILFVAAALPIVLPLIVLVAIMVAVDGSNPFYLQKRIGRGGRTFTMWKVRTMVPNAQGLLEGYLRKNESAQAEWDKDQKLKNDPRITRLGKFLRKSSLDELPQLWNVLKGEMSLVGPRPMLPEQQSMYPGKCYYRLRPGITGLWQVSERNESTFADRAKFDTAYDSSLSLKSDMKILWATVAVVFQGTGY